MTQSDIIQALKRVRSTALLSARWFAVNAALVPPEVPTTQDLTSMAEATKQILNDFPALLEAVKELQAKLDVEVQLRQDIAAQLVKTLAEPSEDEVEKLAEFLFTNNCEDDGETWQWMTTKDGVRGIIVEGYRREAKASLTNFIKGRRK